MNDDQRWTAIEHHRLAIADLLAGLSAPRWESPSLCPAWRVRDVVAHLTLATVPPSHLQLARQIVRSRGSFDRLNAALAVGRAELPPEELVALLRATAGSRAVPVVTNRDNLLLDVLVHGQDIAIPLELNLPVPIEPAVAAADRAWSMGWPFRARRRLRGLRLSATDARWAAGTGPEVHGPISALLLLLTGRTTAALPHLTGPGTARLTTNTNTGHAG